jgi:hypothetical protein
MIKLQIDDENAIPVNLFVKIYGKNDSRTSRILRTALTRFNQVIAEFDTDHSFRDLYFSFSSPKERIQKFDRVIYFLFEYQDAMLRTVFNTLNDSSDALGVKVSQNEVNELSIQITKLIELDSVLPQVWVKLLKMFQVEYKWKKWLITFSPPEVLAIYPHGEVLDTLGTKQLDRMTYFLTILVHRKLSVQKQVIPDVLKNIVEHASSQDYKLYFSRRIPTFDELSITAKDTGKGVFPYEVLVSSVSLTAEVKRVLLSEIQDLLHRLEIWRNIAIFFAEDRVAEKEIIETTWKKVKRCYIWLNL